MSKFLPCLMLLAGAALYGTMSSCVKLANADGFSASELAFWQAFVAALLLGTGALRGGCGLPHVKETLSLLTCGAAIGLTNLLYYSSLATISASLAVVILMQFTWLTLVFDFLLWHRFPTRTEIVAVAGVLTGSVLASGVGFSRCEWAPVGLAFAFGCAATYALYIVLGSRAGTRVPWLSRSALIMTGSAATILLAHPGSFVPTAGFSSVFAGWIAILAVAGCALPTVLFAVAMPQAGPAASAVLMTAELPVAVLTAHLVLGEVVSLTQGVGLTVMLAAIGLLNLTRTQGSAHARRVKGRDASF